MPQGGMVLGNFVDRCLNGFGEGGTRALSIAPHLAVPATQTARCGKLMAQPLDFRLGLGGACQVVLSQIAIDDRQSATPGRDGWILRYQVLHRCLLHLPGKAIARGHGTPR